MANSTNRALLANYLIGQSSGSVLGKNYVKNSMALQNVANVTASGSATVARNTTTPLTAIADFSISLPNNATDYVEWSLDTLDSAVKEQNCELRFDYTASSIGSNVVAQVYQGSNKAIESSPLAVQSTSTTVSVNVPCGDLSSSTTIRIANGTGNSGTSALKVANVSYGKASNIGTVAQAQLWGSINVTGCSSNWTVNSGSYAIPSTVSGCSYVATGNASAPSTNLPAIKFSHLPPGDYFVTAHATFSAGTGAGYFQITDGTTVAKEEGTTTDSFGMIGGKLSYATAQTDVTIQIQMKGTNTSIGVNPPSFSIQVYRFPTSSEIVYRPELQNQYAGVRWAPGPTGRVASVTSGSWTTFSDPDFATRTNSGKAVDPTSTSTIGFKFNSLQPGKYLLLAQGQFLASSGDSCIFGLYDGTNRRGETSLPTGTSAISSLMGEFEYSSVQSSVEFVIQAYRGSGSGSGCQIYADYGGPTLDSLQMFLIPLTQNIPAPVLVGSITSNSVGAERVERLRFGGASERSNCTSGPCTVYSQSGSWISSVSRNSIGNYTINITSGIFSGEPTCVCTAKSIGAYNTFCEPTDATGSATSKRFDVMEVAGTPANRDAYVEIICMGPR